MKVNPLIVTLSARDYNTCEYWHEQIDFCDRLLIKNYWMMEGHPIGRKYFLEHPEYTHYIVLAEDLICPPDMVKLLIDDIYEHDFPVVAGLLNVDFTSVSASISFRDMRKIVVRSRHVYQHPSFKDLLLGKHGFPFVNVTFQGDALASYRRDIVKRLTFKPYNYISDKVRKIYFACNKPFGHMFDLQKCIELLDMGVPIVVDLRIMLMHFAFGASVFNFAHLPRTATLIRADGTREVIKEDEPYRNGEYKPEQRVRRKLSKEEFRRIFHGTPRKIKKSEVVPEKPLKESSEEPADSSEDSRTVLDHDGG